MSHFSIIDDDAADTLRYVCHDFDGDTDIDLTSCLTSCHIRLVDRTTVRRRKIRETRENVFRLREALAEGWDIGPELAYEEKRLAVLEARA